MCRILVCVYKKVTAIVSDTLNVNCDLLVAMFSVKHKAYSFKGFHFSFSSV